MPNEPGGNTVPRIAGAEHDDAALAKKVLMRGYDGTNYNTLTVDSNGGMARGFAVSAGSFYSADVASISAASSHTTDSSEIDVRQYEKCSVSIKATRADTGATGDCIVSIAATVEDPAGVDFTDATFDTLDNATFLIRLQLDDADAALPLRGTFTLELGAITGLKVINVENEDDAAITAVNIDYCLK